jgi:hypothetical protein
MTRSFSPTVNGSVSAMVLQVCALQDPAKERTLRGIGPLT